MEEEEEELKKKSQGAGEPLQTLASKLSAEEFILGICASSTPGFTWASALWLNQYLVERMFLVARPLRWVGGIRFEIV